MARTQVFISYAHVDNHWRLRVVSHLGVLARARLIDIWDDRRLEAGDDWLARIKDGMSRARIALLLISAPFLNSDFIRKKEIPALFRRQESDGMIVYPLLIKSCPWKEVKWLKRMQIRPEDGRPVAGFRGNKIDDVLTKVALEIAAMARKRGSGKARKRVSKKSQTRASKRVRPRAAKKVRPSSTKTRTRASKRVRQGAAKKVRPSSAKTRTRASTIGRRKPNKDVNGREFSEATIDQVWKKGGVISGQDSDVMRKDACGESIKRAEHGNTNSAYGWEVDHKKPVAEGGGDELSNLQPLNWKTNRDKSDTYPWSCP